MIRRIKFKKMPAPAGSRIPIDFHYNYKNRREKTTHARLTKNTRETALHAGNNIPVPMFISCSIC